MSSHAIIGKPAPDFDEEAVLGQDFTRVKLSDFNGIIIISNPPPPLPPRESLRAFTKKLIYMP
jgi:hypothetical protein